jgi:hypothetical protein
MLHQLIAEPSHNAAQRVVNARSALMSHPHFRGRVDYLEFEARPEGLVVTGRLPSFYLKQLLQTVLLGIPGVKRVVNRTDVICSQGLSGCSRTTRDRCALEHFWLNKTPRCFPTCDGIPGFVAGDDAGEVHACPVPSHMFGDATNVGGQSLSWGFEATSIEN